MIRVSFSLRPVSFRYCSTFTAGMCIETVIARVPCFTVSVPYFTMSVPHFTVSVPRLTISASSVQVVPSTTEPSNATDNKQDGSPTSARHILQKLENASEVKDNLKDYACLQHTEHEAQTVPTVPSFDGKMDDGAESGFGSVFSQKMLQQLDALQKGISLIDNHVE